MKKTDLSKYNNDWYNIGAVTPKLVVWYFVNLCFLRSGWLPINGVKVFILRIFGAKVERNVIIKPHVNIKYPWKLSIGNNVWIGENVWIDNLGDVTIGDNVCISQGAMLLCGNHDYKSSSFDLRIGDITLEEGVWIGAKSVVCPGVTCCSHSVLSVNSVATRDLESYKIYQGNPAVFVREREIN